MLDRDDGALYRGARLEHVIDVTDDRAETLPHLEREFLDASRTVRDEERDAEAQHVVRQVRTNRRLRLLVAGIAAGLVVALALGFVAVDQRNRANAERRVAVARELAAASVANLDTDPERSVLLALEALARTHDGDGEVVREAEGALHQAVVASRVVLRVPNLGGSVDWSADGATFVTEGPEDSGIVDIRDAKTGASVRSWPGHEVDVNFVLFSDDGSMLATTGDDGALRVWDPASGEELFAYERPEDGSVTSPSFAPDGNRVAAGWAGRSRARVRRAHGRRDRRVRRDAGTVHNCLQPRRHRDRDRLAGPTAGDRDRRRDRRRAVSPRRTHRSDQRGDVES